MSYRPEGWENPHVNKDAKSMGWPDSIYEPIFEAGADALEELLKANGQKVEKGDTIKFFRNHPGVGMKQYYAFSFEAPNIVCSIPEEPGE